MLFHPRATALTPVTVSFVPKAKDCAPHACELNPPAKEFLPIAVLPVPMTEDTESTEQKLPLLLTVTLVPIWALVLVTATIMKKNAAMVLKMKLFVMVSLFLLLFLTLL